VPSPTKPSLLPLFSQNEIRLKVYNPGGLNRKRIDNRFNNAILLHFTHYSAANKLKIVAAVDKMMAEEYLRQNQAWKILQVRNSHVLRWQANCALLEEAARLEKQTLHEGPVGCVDAFTEELVSFVEEWRGKGILVSCLCLIIEACKMSPAFSNKTLSAQKAAISCFMAKNGLVHSMAMHTVQHPPQEMCNEAQGFLQQIVPMVNNGNRLPTFTINMDQTPVLHAINPKDTINRRGMKTINLQTAGGDSRQVTIAITIMAFGHQLPSLVVFKGKSIHFCTADTVCNIMVDCCVLAAGMPNGMIACREAPTLPVGSIYCLNKKVWLNKQIMLNWINHVLALNAIQALAVQVKFIPAGCTGLVQPVNVGFNKAFKCKMHDKFLK
jgi:hypothetical protein